MVMPLLIRDVDVLSGGDGSDWRMERHDVLIEDGRFRDIADPGAIATAPGWEVVPGHGLLAAPGLINSHTHSPLAPLRGTTDGLDHVEFMWTNQADTLGRTPEEIYAATVLSCLDMLRNGVTAAIDHVPEQNASLDLIEPVVRAYRDTGMRAVLGLRIFDRSYDDIIETLSPENARILASHNPLEPRPADELLALCAEAAEKWTSQEGMVAIFPAPSNPLRCSDELLAGCEALAAEHDMGVHTHLLETRIQVTLAKNAYGRTMVAHMDAIGALSARWSLAHGVWVDEADDATLARHGAVIVHNPHSNAKIGAGTAPISRMRAAGVEIALGTDGASTNDTLSMHEAMAFAALLSRTGDAQRGHWLMAADVLSMATRGGAAAMNARDTLGSIALGRHADLVLYRLDDFALLPLNDPVQQMVFSERGRAVAATIINGKTVYRDGKFTWGDPADLFSVLRSMRSRQITEYAALRRFGG